MALVEQVSGFVGKILVSVGSYFPFLSMKYVALNRTTKKTKAQLPMEMVPFFYATEE